MTFDLFVQEYYKYIINCLKTFNNYDGLDVFGDGNDIKEFYKKYSDYIVDAFFNSFLFTFTLTKNSPTEAFLELMEIYSNKFVNLAPIFLGKECLIKIYKTGHFKEYVDASIEVLNQQGILG